MSLEPHLEYMKLAIAEAQKAASVGEVPVGALIVDPEGTILAKTHNKVEEGNSVTNHAEMLAIQKASSTANNWRLNDCSLYVTLEPCIMCAWAIKLSRIKNVIYGSPDIRMGGFGTKINLSGEEHIGIKTDIFPGVCEEECSKLLKDFFQQRRQEKQ